MVMLLSLAMIGVTILGTISHGNATIYEACDHGHGHAPTNTTSHGHSITITGHVHGTPANHKHCQSAHTSHGIMA